MLCLFCKNSSADSKGLEHIIPESLGNKKHVLGRGSVCDKCNNYFSREVEGPVLSHRAFRNLRAWNGIPSKKGKVPPLLAKHFSTEIDVAIHLSDGGNVSIGVERARDFDELFRGLASDESTGWSGFGFDLNLEPPKKLMSRLLAKMALEKVYYRLSLCNDGSLLDRLIFDPHYDRIRNWARRGDNFTDWPFHQRRIAPEETLMRHPETGDWVRIGIAHDLLLTSRPETFFAISFHGMEFVINVGGPSIKGYERWLKENSDNSPLIERVGLKLSASFYSGKFRTFLHNKDAPPWTDMA
jgi:hypothetical protein